MFLDLKKVNEDFKSELNSAFCEVLDSGVFINGARVRQFEKSLAEYLGVKHVVGVGNGYDALRLIFRAYLEMGLLAEGDEVLVPANTYIASILAISENKLKPVLIEPDFGTFLLDPSALLSEISDRTKALLLVHLYGRACWSHELDDLVNSEKLIVIEDNAQALGAEHGCRKTGSLGNSAGNSFYPSKNLGAFGDAGAISTNDGELAEVARSLSNYGSSKRNLFSYRGVNSRLDELQAALLLVKLKHLDYQNQSRREIAAYYLNKIKNPAVVTPALKQDAAFFKEHVWHLFVILHNRRNELLDYLAERGIEAMIHYPVPPHRQKAYMGYFDKEYPVTETIHDQAVSLPLYPGMDYSYVDHIINSVNEFCQWP